MNQSSCSEMAENKDPQQSKRKKVLVVDDSRTVRGTMRNFLKILGDFEYLEAEDGEEGFQQVKLHPDLFLVLLDINMPKIDGLTLAEKIQKELASNVPIVILTTEDDPKMMARAQKAGVMGWIIKPPRKKAILQVIERVIAKEKIRQSA